MWLVDVILIVYSRHIVKLHAFYRSHLALWAGPEHVPAKQIRL